MVFRINSQINIKEIKKYPAKNENFVNNKELMTINYNESQTKVYNKTKITKSYKPNNEAKNNTKLENSKLKSNNIEQEKNPNQKFNQNFSRNKSNLLIRKSNIVKDNLDHKILSETCKNDQNETNNSINKQINLNKLQIRNKTKKNSSITCTYAHEKAQNEESFYINLNEMMNESLNIKSSLNNQERGIDIISITNNSKSEQFNSKKPSKKPKTSQIFIENGKKIPLIAISKTASFHNLDQIKINNESSRTYKDNVNLSIIKNEQLNYLRKFGVHRAENLVEEQNLYFTINEKNNKTVKKQDTFSNNLGTTFNKSFLTNNLQTMYDPEIEKFAKDFALDFNNLKVPKRDDIRLKFEEIDKKNPRYDSLNKGLISDNIHQKYSKINVKVIEKIDKNIEKFGKNRVKIG